MRAVLRLCADVEAGCAGRRLALPDDQSGLRREVRGWVLTLWSEQTAFAFDWNSLADSWPLELEPPPPQPAATTTNATSVDKMTALCIDSSALTRTVSRLSCA